MKKSESVNGPVDEDWAVPVTDPVKDFHTRVPDMAREVSCILKKAQCYNMQYFHYKFTSVACEKIILSI
jgi:hypothetical protein